ncbi:MAG: ATP-grasp domain-containing protein [Patescibacteria group bacterium]
MQLILINHGHNPKCEEYLLKAAKKRKLETKIVSTQKNIFEITTAKPLSKTLLYRIAIERSEATLERIYLTRGAVGFSEEGQYSKRITNKLVRYMDFEKAGVPIPPTIFSNSTSSENLKKIAQKLGLPLVIKTLDGSKGEGTLVVDSFFALKSTVPLLVGQELEFVFQKMIREAAGRHVRVIVLGGKIVCAYQKSIPKKIDFRSNATDKARRKIVHLDAQTENFVLKAVAASGVSFGGVDLLPTKKGYLITEVNSPCNFAASQDFTGIDIAGLMLDFLIAKAQRK